MRASLTSSKSTLYTVLRGRPRTPLPYDGAAQWVAHLLTRGRPLGRTRQLHRVPNGKTMTGPAYRTEVKKELGRNPYAKYITYVPTPNKYSKHALRRATFFCSRPT
jgi:hypothetical protein